MERLEGHVVTDDAAARARHAGGARADDGAASSEVLVEIHAVDPATPGLDGFGKPTGYLERQLRRWAGLWEHNKTRELADFDAAGAWLADHLPESPPSTVVHGDYRLGNVMFADEAPTRLVGVFDWEMATIGDPLSDLGYLLMTWSEADDPAWHVRARAGDATGGLPDAARSSSPATRSSAGARCPTSAGTSSLALWKATVFMEGNYRRALEGRTDDPYLKGFGDGVVELAGARGSSPRRASARCRGRASSRRLLMSLRPASSICLRVLGSLAAATALSASSRALLGLARTSRSC